MSSPLLSSHILSLLLFLFYSHTLGLLSLPAAGVKMTEWEFAELCPCLSGKLYLTARNVPA